MEENQSDPLEGLQEIISDLSALAYTAIPNWHIDRYELVVSLRPGDGEKEDLRELEKFATEHDLYFGAKVIKEGNDPVAFLRPKNKN